MTAATTESATIEQLIRRPAAAVWEAITSPDWLARWWGAGDIRPEVGHRFHLDMGKWGMQPCEVLEVVPERRLVYTFADWRLVWTLEQREGATLLRLEHQGFDLTNPTHVHAFETMPKGWASHVLPRLAALVEAA
jgi:uncharacterized protein YndB with AHSA1/START domain